MIPKGVDKYVKDHKEELRGPKGDRGPRGPQGPRGSDGEGYFDYKYHEGDKYLYPKDYA